MKGLIVSIYRADGYKCWLNVLNNVNNAVIIDKDIDEIFTPDEQAPAIRIVRRNINGNEYIHAEPMEKGFYAFGGSYVTCSDSRVKALNKYPIPLHDRDMSKE